MFYVLNNTLVNMLMSSSMFEFCLGIKEMMYLSKKISLITNRQ